MKTWTTILAACMSAILYFSRPADEPALEPAVAAACCGDNCDCCDCDIDAVIARIEAVEAKVASVQEAVRVITVAKPEPLPPPAPVKVVPAVNYEPRWQNYDGKSRMQHAVDDHGIDVSKYSQAQVLQMMDADHDRYGAGHSAIQASRSVVTYSQAPVTYSQATYKAPLQSYSTQTYSNCPGGVCPTQPQARQTVRRGLFGWRR